MTKTARKSFSRKLILLLIVALLCVVLALQLVSAPIFSVAPGNTASADEGDSNGVKISYNEAKTGLISDKESMLSNPSVGDYASAAATPAKNDEVSVIVSLDGTPMMQFATANNISVAEALATQEGKKNLDNLINIRNLAYNSVSDYIIEYGYEYSTIMNAFSATVKYGDIDAIKSNKYVNSVIVSNTYLAPQTVTENYVDVYETGIFNSEGVGYDGTGTVVAVVDTGTDYTHEVFDMELDPNTLAITKDDVAAVAPILTATSLSAMQGESINEDDLYLKSKLPFAYDYADSDANVYPHESHGTHVAGIIAGKSVTITGVAPRAQIATIKVFSDYSSGAKTEWILAGLNDAVTLGVDAINMSLGTSCGFSREVDEEEINKIYDAINDAGICLVVAASNDASSAQNSTWGNTNLATNPDSGTVGSPGSYTASLSVGSVSGVKTRYFMVDGHEIYFAESRLVGKTESNKFVEELLGDKAEGEYEYVVVPGVGLSVNYTGIDVEGKIAVVKRGTNNFEDKVKIAMDRGAVAVICYNNVSGTINMSIGTKPLIPSCFITMDLAKPLVASGSGVLKVSKDYLAGPFMSDFSSWGVLPDLTLAPDITAHGGEIYSSVAGGDKYDRLSGTSMAAPNLAGALILVRQYVKEANPDYVTTQTRDESYSRMMSTGTIVLNEYGNPYSPRKQGAGIADISHSINTKAYLTVDGSNKPKLSLGDDPTRTGEYTMKFNLVNISGNAVSYNFGAYVMTESMSSDERTVAEKAYMFDDTTNTYTATARKGKVVQNGNTVSVSGYGEAEITAKVKLSAKDKEYLNTLFRNGMFVEGYILLESNNLDGIDLNIPFVAFYGDWTDAPMLDVTAYQVGESNADDSVIAEEKLKADVYGTLPYAGFASATAADGIGYFGMGAFLYIPAPGYTAPETQEKFAALTTNPDGNYLFYAVSAGLLRGAKRVDWEIRNSATGELIKSGVDYNARKSHSSGGDQTGGYVQIELDIRDLDLPNNAKYTFNMACYLDWKDDSGEYPYGNKNTFSFEFTVDNEAPELSDVAVRKDVSGSNTRYYLDLTMYDNHYLQALAIYTYEGKDENDNITDATSLLGGIGLIPANAEYSRDTTVSIEVTQYWSLIQANGGKLYVNAYDYANNDAAFEIEIEEETDLQISKTRTARDEYTVVPNGQMDLAEYITVRANTLDDVDDDDKAYIDGYWTKDLIWESSDPTVVEVDRNSGLITGLKAGSAVITVRTPNVEAFDENDSEHCLKFTITVAGDATEIKLSSIEMYVYKTDESGNVVHETQSNSLALERGEYAVIGAKVKPYNYTEKVTLDWTSTSSNVRIESVAADGMSAKIFAVKSGSATIRTTVSGSRISGYTSVRVKNEYNVDTVYLRSYTGRGGEYINEKGETEQNVVEIPDDLGIVYIYPRAFINNEYIEKVIIPEGVTTIMQYAFYGCSNLKEVVLPSTVETIEEGAFFQPLKDREEFPDDYQRKFPDDYIITGKLEKINLGKVKSIGERAFLGGMMEEVDLSSCTYIDSLAFAYCTKLKTFDLSRVGIVSGGAFEYCLALETLNVPESTTLEYHTNGFGNIGAFINCKNLKSVVIRSDYIGEATFALCDNLKSVTFMNDVDEIGELAFYNCKSLTDVTFNGSVYKIGDNAFADCSSLPSITLPAGLTVMGRQVFGGCRSLTTMKISSGALLSDIDASAFFTGYLRIKSFIVESGNKYLSSEDGVLFDRAKKRLIAYPFGKGTLDANGKLILSSANYVVPASVKTIGKSAFSSAYYLTNIDLNNVEYIEAYAFSSAKAFNYDSSGDISPNLNITGYNNVRYIGEGAFMSSALTNLPISDKITYIGDGAFMACTNLTTTVLNIPASLQYLGNMAFSYSMQSETSYYVVPLTEVSFANSTLKSVGECAFQGCTELVSVNLGKLTSISDGMFYACEGLESIVIPNTIERIGIMAFAYCSKLSNVTLSNQLTRIPDGAFSDTPLTSITIPDSVTSIGDAAFMNTQLASIDLKNVTSIGNYAFSKSALKDVASDKVVSVGDHAFAECALLESVNFSKAESIGASAFEKCAKLTAALLMSATKIGNSAFAECALLPTVVIPNAKTIGDSAFKNAAKLSTLNLGSVEEIGSNAFSGTIIAKLSLPETLVKVTDGAFYGAARLTEITVDESNKLFKSDNGVLYSVTPDNYYVLIGYPANKTDVTAYTVLDRTIKLGAYSFDGNTTLTKLTLPAHLQVIGMSAMKGMSELKEIVFNSVIAPTLESRSWVEYHEPDKYGNPVYDYFNQYDNFSFAYDPQNPDSGSLDLTITVPANNTGYFNNKIWNAYVGKYIHASDKIHATLDTLNFIERVKALPANPTAADAAEITALLRTYNMFNSAQASIIRGQYTSYNDNGNKIDADYYTALLNGVNYYEMLTAAQNKLPRSVASAINSAVYGEQTAVSGAQSNIDLVVIVCAAVTVIGAVIASAIANKRRARK